VCVRVETSQGRRFSEIHGWTSLSPPDGQTSGNSVFSNRFAFFGSNLFSQPSTLATGVGNGVSPSGFSHCRRQLSGSSHFVPCPSSCHRPSKAISAANVSASWRPAHHHCPTDFGTQPLPANWTTAKLFIRHIAMQPLGVAVIERPHNWVASVLIHGEAHVHHASRLHKPGIVIGKSAHQGGISGRRGFLSYCNGSNQNDRCY
jgi:hypothetical protein